MMRDELGWRTYCEGCVSIGAQDAHDLVSVPDVYIVWSRGHIPEHPSIHELAGLEPQMPAHVYSTMLANLFKEIRTQVIVCIH